MEAQNRDRNPKCGALGQSKGKRIRHGQRPIGGGKHCRVCVRGWCQGGKILALRAGALEPLSFVRNSNVLADLAKGNGRSPSRHPIGAVQNEDGENMEEQETGEGESVIGIGLEHGSRSEEDKTAESETDESDYEDVVGINEQEICRKYAGRYFIQRKGRTNSIIGLGSIMGLGCGKATLGRMMKGM
ncbi:hypothetical protein PIB30_075237 [Stylosanthes scabra]|uniref:Uncharacterized protein n=1 Tax=Stylosanthes scabra TaxID=79078 RepID=A0ABU6SQU6_9FABA|nr:hypothetical protein [Stylosanthes scabra]